MKNLDEPAYSLREAAEIAMVAEPRLRGWLDRGLSQWVGLKRGHFVRFSAREIAIVTVAADLVRLGFPPIVAGRISTALLYESPDADRVVKKLPAALADERPPGHACREPAREPEPTATHVEIPVGAIWTRVMREAGRIYATSAA